MASGEVVDVNSVCYSVEGHNLLVGILQEEIHRRKAAEDQLAIRDADIVLLRRQAELHALDIEKWEIVCEIERLKRPTWLEQHTGFCAGVGVGINSTGEAEAMAGVLFGLKF